MFRLNAIGLPKDPVYPTKLSALGYQIAPTTSGITSIAHGDHYRYLFNKNERFNDRFREALHTSIRNEIYSRLSALGLKPLYINSLTTVQPADIPSVPVFMTPPEIMRKKNMVILINNSSAEDLGIWSWHGITKAGGGINNGSAVGLVREILARANGVDLSKNPNAALDPMADAAPGFLILNPGQQLYSYKEGRAMTHMSWDALPRKSAVHEPIDVHPVYNTIEGSRSPHEHTKFALHNIVANTLFVSKDARIYTIGIGDGGSELANVIDAYYTTFLPRIACLALAGPPPITTANPAFARFLRDRTLAWTLSDHPVDMPLSNAIPSDTTDIDACHATGPFPILSSSEPSRAEAILPTCYTSILNWFEEIATEDAERTEKEIAEETGGYTNGVFDIPEVVLNELREKEKSNEEPDWSGWDDGNEVGGEDGANGREVVKGFVAEAAGTAKEAEV